MSPPRARKPPPPPKVGFWAMMARRPTSDLIVLGLTIVVAFSVFAIVIATLYVKVFHPEDDVSALLKQLGAFLSSLIAVIVGYVAGRGVNTPAPDEHPPPKPE